MLLKNKKIVLIIVVALIVFSLGYLYIPVITIVIPPSPIPCHGARTKYYLADIPGKNGRNSWTVDLGEMKYRELGEFLREKGWEIEYPHYGKEGEYQRVDGKKKVKGIFVRNITFGFIFMEPGEAGDRKRLSFYINGGTRIDNWILYREFLNDLNEEFNLAIEKDNYFSFRHERSCSY